MISIIILGLVFLLIAVRQVGSLRLQIWQVMLGGAAAVLVTGAIGVMDAVHAINVDVMLFLFCMFLVGRALEESGYLHQLAFNMFRRARSTDALVLTILFGVGMLSAVLMNDTLAIVGTPIVLYFATKHRISAKLLLLSLCFAITIGSLMSPIGSPHNLLIAFNVPNPFVAFLMRLLVPTVLALLGTYALLKLFFPKEFHKEEIVHTSPELKDARLALLSKVAILLLLAGIILKVGLVFFGVEFRMTYIAAAAAVPILFSPRRIELIRGVDWYTLIFFAAMFILMKAVWYDVSPIITPYVSTSLLFILLASILVSQLISNVPFVALSIPALLAAGAGSKEMVALAAGSTLAGNLFILGAASNVIVIQQAEERGETLTFWEFARVGIPVTLLCFGIYWAFLA